MSQSIQLKGLPCVEPGLVSQLTWTNDLVPGAGLSKRHQGESEIPGAWGISWRRNLCEREDWTGLEWAQRLKQIKDILGRGNQG